MQIRYSLRNMQKEDIPRVHAIDREAFPTQWPPPPFKRDLENRIVRYLVAVEDRAILIQDDNGRYSGYGSGLKSFVSRLSQLFAREQPVTRDPAQDNHCVVGYAALWLMVDEAHLTSIAVKADCQRRGIGELLLIGMIDLALQVKAKTLTLETRVSNQPAQALYEKYGFSQTGVRRSYYSDNGEDAVIMSTDDITSESYQTRLRQLRQAYIERWSLERAHRT